MQPGQEDPYQQQPDPTLSYPTPGPDPVDGAPPPAPEPYPTYGSPVPGSGPPSTYQPTSGPPSTYQPGGYPPPGGYAPPGAYGQQAYFPGQQPYIPGQQGYFPGQTPLSGGPGGPQNTQGLISLILGIVSIPIFCCPLGIPVGIAAIIFGILGLNKAGAGLATNRGQALAGLITGGVGVLLSLIVLVGSIISGSWHLSSYSNV